MTKDDHLIWTSEPDYRDWKDYLEQEYPEMTENERMDEMFRINNGYLGDEKENLNIQLPGPILVIADLGLWNGRHNGYHEIESGNISDCLYSECDAATWYVDKFGDLRCDAIHHDGENHYLYRTYRDGVSGDAIDNLKWKIYNGTVRRSDIDLCTRSLGSEIGAVYGWEFSVRQPIGARGNER